MDPDTMQKNMQKDPNTIQKTLDERGFSILELLKRKGGKKNGEWFVAIDIDFYNNVE